MSVITKTKTIIVGKVVKPHGIQGGVKVKPFTEDFKGFLTYDFFFLSRKQDILGLKLHVLKVDPLKGLLVVYFNGVDGLDQADELRDMFLQVTRDMVVLKQKLSEDDILIEDLIGFYVFEGDHCLGYVEGYYEGGANGLYLVKRSKLLSESLSERSQTKNRIRIDREDFFIPCDMSFYQGIDFDRKYIFLNSNSYISQQ